MRERLLLRIDTFGGQSGSALSDYNASATESLFTLTRIIQFRHRIVTPVFNIWSRGTDKSSVESFNDFCRPTKRGAQMASVISGLFGSRRYANPHARVYFTSGPVPLPEIAAMTDSSGEFSLNRRRSG